MDDLLGAEACGPDLDAHAQSIRAAYAGAQIAPIRQAEPGLTVEDAYRVQAINRELWCAEGRKIIGTKIGLTSLAVQRQLGVEEPDYGYLFDDMQIIAGGAVPPGRLHQPRVEAEIAFVLRSDVLESLTSLAEAAAVISHALPALEIVDSRIADWDITLVDTVADNASAGLFVIGSEGVALDRLDLASCTMTMEQNGRLVSEGSGAACLGNPLKALQWLSAARCARGDPLRAGDIILSGALGPVVAAAQGDHFAATITGVGEIAVSFAN